MKKPHLIASLLLLLTALPLSAAVWTDYRETFPGSGTAGDPYTIATAGQLAQLAYDVTQGNEYEGKIFVQTADIDLYKEVEGERVHWVPIGGFVGTTPYTFKGNYFGHQLWGNDATNRRFAIKNMYINAEISTSGDHSYICSGLFGRAGGVLRDITITGADVYLKRTSVAPDVGLLCGYYVPRNSNPRFAMDIFGCTAEGSLNVEGPDVTCIGGLVGYIYGYGPTAIEQCSAHVTIKDKGSTHLVGGIVGRSQNASVSDCTAQVNMTSDASGSKGRYGGIAGYVECKTSSSTTMYMARNVVNACTVTGTMTITSARTDDDKHKVGGIVGEALQTIVASCVSMPTIVSNGKVGGIISCINVSDAYKEKQSRLEHSVFAGHIDATQAEKAGGLVTTVWYPYDEHVSNCLMLGTITTGTNAANCYAIVADCSGGEGCNPLTNIALCYYDETLCGCQALPATQTTHPTVAGLSTAQLTSGQQSVVRLTSDERKGFVLAKGYYPRVTATGHWARLALLSNDAAYASYIQNRASDLTAFLGSSDLLPAYTDNLTDDGTIRLQLYHTGAWLASLPLTMEQGDLAYDFVSTITAKQQLGLWTEHRFNATEQQWQEREVRQSNTVNIPKDATCIKVSGQKATVCDRGTFTLSLAAGTLQRPAGFTISSFGTKWNGNEASNFAAGSGSFADPYIIRSPEQLAYAVKHCEEGKYYRQICDLWLNMGLDGGHLLTGTFDQWQSTSPQSGYQLWPEGTTWSGHYDGVGHFVRSCYGFAWWWTTPTAYGLFGTITREATVENLGISDMLIHSTYPNISNLPEYNNSIGLLAGICEGTVRNCIVQGAINGWLASVKQYVGGICGRVGVENASALVEDCISAAVIYNNYALAGAFVSRWPQSSLGKVSHCLMAAPISLKGSWYDREAYQPHEQYPDITEYRAVEREAKGESDCLVDCHYPYGYRYSTRETFTDDDLTTLNSAFAGCSLWQTEDGFLPTLRAFADTQLGRMLTLPLKPAEGDYAMMMNKQMEFNPGNLTWSCSIGNHFDVDSDMGVASPENYSTDPESTTDIVQLYGVSPNGRERVVYSINPGLQSTVQMGISFVDDYARQTCHAAFDNNPKDGFISLKELKAVTNEQVLTAFQTETARHIQQFPEFRYFKAVTELTTQLQSMSSLKSIELPFALQSVASNAFSGCTALDEVTLPAKVATVGEHPFYGSGVKNVYVDKFNEHLTARDGLLFDTSDRLLAYPNGRTGSATISGDVTEIAPGALYKLQDCDSIFIDAPNYWDVTCLNEGGIVTADGSLPLVYINDATYDQTLLDSYLYDDSWWDYADRLRRYYPLTVTSAKAATFYIGFDTQLPDGVKPYVVSSMDESEEGVAYLTRLTNTRGDMTMQVPELTPVVVFADKAGLYKLFPLDNDKLDLFPMWQNRLNGSDRDGLPVYQEDSASGNVLTLGRNSSGELGFFYYTGERVPPYRAYLNVNDITGARSFTLLFDDPSGIDAVQDSGSHEHLTLTHGSVYDLQGRPVAHPQRGSLYIKNGRKFVMK